MPQLKDLPNFLLIYFIFVTNKKKNFITTTAPPIYSKYDKFSIKNKFNLIFFLPPNANNANPLANPLQQN